MRFKNLDEVSRNGIGKVYIGTRAFVHTVEGREIDIGSYVETIEITSTILKPEENCDYSYLESDEGYLGRFYFPSSKSRAVFSTFSEAFVWSKLPKMDLTELSRDRSRKPKKDNREWVKIERAYNKKFR